MYFRDRPRWSTSMVILALCAAVQLSAGCGADRTSQSSTRASAAPSIRLSKRVMVPGSCFRIHVRGDEDYTWDQDWKLQREVREGWRTIRTLVVYPNKHFFQYRHPQFRTRWRIGYSWDDTLFVGLRHARPGRYRLLKEFVPRKNFAAQAITATAGFSVEGEPVVRSKERCRRPRPHAT